MSSSIPHVGDLWVGEDYEGRPIYRKVVEVMPPQKWGEEWLIKLEGAEGLVHRGWWYGQGWSEVEPEEG